VCVGVRGCVCVRCGPAVPACDCIPGVCAVAAPQVDGHWGLYPSDDDGSGKTPKQDFNNNAVGVMVGAVVVAVVMLFALGCLLIVLRSCLLILMSAASGSEAAMIRSRAQAQSLHDEEHGHAPSVAAEAAQPQQV
jgi:hypothetical protein